MKAIRLLLVSPNAKANQTKKIRRGFINSRACSFVRILGFEREGEGSTDFEYESLGIISRKKYLRRIIQWRAAISKVAVAIAQSDVVFTWTLDCLIVTLLARLFSTNRNIKIVYNVRDIHPALTSNNICGALLRRIDKIASRFVNLFVFTSPAYVHYYNNVLGLKDIEWLSLENKVPEELWATVSRDDAIKVVGEMPVIGYFGVMSYQNSWEIIKKSARFGVNFYMRGTNYLGEFFLDDLNDLKNVIYEGPYKNPEDLANIFSRIDVSWAVNSEHFQPNTNDQWAMCNRFYEGLYFKKPLIVQEGSAHSDFVKKFDIGIVVDTRNSNETIGKLCSIKADDIKRWRKNIDAIDESVFIMGRSDYSNILKNLFRTD